MSKVKDVDLYERIHIFQRETLANKPAPDKMYHEVRMMNFKVRPVVGDISQLDFENMEFIDALWSIGKLDEFFRHEMSRISKDEREVFFRLIDEMRTNFQIQLNRANIANPHKPLARRSVFEVEIIKDQNLLIH